MTRSQRNGLLGGVLLCASCAVILSCTGFEATSSSGDGGLDATSADATPAVVVADAGADADADADTPPPGRCAHCRSKYCDDAGACDPLVFITIDTFYGDLRRIANGDGGTGLAQADEICRLAGDGGAFHAWLSDNSHDALSRVVGDGLASPRPLRRADGAIVANSIADLVAEDGGWALVPINLGANGTPVPPDRVWTGTNENGGRRTDLNCASWTSGMGGSNGTQGTTAIAGQPWTVVRDSEPNVACDQRAHLYCFEELH